MHRIIALSIALCLFGCAPSDRGDATRGMRIATITGCISCHGEKLDGHLFEEDPKVVLAYSSNLSRILPSWSDAQIAQAVRAGRRPNGAALWFMPTFALRHMTDRDMADLIAWLRRVPPRGVLHPPVKPGPVLLRAIAAHQAMTSPEEMAYYGTRAPVDVGADYAQGRYLAALTCAQCHGPDLKGVKHPGPGDPADLAVAAAYGEADFARLLRTGAAPGGRRVGLMSQEAPERLKALTDAEITAIHAYLIARAHRAG